MAGVKGMRGSGGRREGAGRPRGSKNKRTRETIERVAAAAADRELEDVVVLLTRWANDSTKDDHFRAACAGKAGRVHAFKAGTAARASAAAARNPAVDAGRFREAAVGRPGAASGALWAALAKTKTRRQQGQEAI